MKNNKSSKDDYEDKDSEFICEKCKRPIEEYSILPKISFNNRVEKTKFIDDMRIFYHFMMVIFFIVLGIRDNIFWLLVSVLFFIALILLIIKRLEFNKK